MAKYDLPTELNFVMNYTNSQKVNKPVIAIYHHNHVRMLIKPIVRRFINLLSVNTHMRILIAPIVRRCKYMLSFSMMLIMTQYDEIHMSKLTTRIVRRCVCTFYEHDLD